MEKEGECEVVWAQTLTNLPNATKNEREPPWLAKQLQNKHVIGCNEPPHKKSSRLRQVSQN